MMNDSYINLSRRQPPPRFRDVGGQYTRSGQHGMAYGTREYLDHQRRTGYQFGTPPPVVDDGSGRGKNLPSGGGYGGGLRGASSAMRRVFPGLAKAHPLLRGVSLAFDIANALDPNGEWSQQPGQSLQDVAKAGGYSECCRIGDDPRWGADMGGDGVYNRKWECSDWRINCGLSLQPAYEWDVSAFDVPAVSNPTSSTRYQYKDVYGLGRGVNPTRGTVTAKYLFERAIAPFSNAPALEFVPQPARTIPVAGAPRPLPPAITESVNGSPENTRPNRPENAPPAYRQPSADIAIGGRTQPGAQLKPKPGWHDRRPPNKTDTNNPEKEKKSKPIPLGALGGFYDKVTEAAEVVEALAANTPQCKNVKGMAYQLNCLYDNLDDLDVLGAVSDLIANEAEDRAIGAIHGAGKKAGAPFGSSMFTGYIP